MTVTDPQVDVLAGLAPAGMLRRRLFHERLIRGVLVFVTSLTVLTTALIVFSLVEPTFEFFRAVAPSEFFGSTVWAPLFEPASFGVWPIVGGTLMVTAIAVVTAVPVGLGAAFYLSEYARPRVRRIVKPALEMLAGIPTVVFGFFALYFVNPQLVKRLWPFGDVGTYSVLGCGLVMGMMIVPIVASLSEDSMSAVPSALREGAFALGATRREVSTQVVFRASLSGIVAAVVLAVSRAVGETMIALLAAGNRPNLSLNPGEDAQTMTAFIGSAAQGDQPTGSIGYKTIFAVGALLFVMTFCLNMASIRIVRRFREVYE